jgi:hypothetical protein
MNPKTVSAKYVETEEAKRQKLYFFARGHGGRRLVPRFELATDHRAHQDGSEAGRQLVPVFDGALADHHLYRGRAVYLTSELNKVWHQYGNPTPSH